MFFQYISFKRISISLNWINILIFHIFFAELLIYILPAFIPKIRPKKKN